MNLVTQMDRDGFVSTLHSLYISNHPDRMGFGGSPEQLVEWAVGMGLLLPTEGELLIATHVPGFYTTADPLL